MIYWTYRLLRFLLIITFSEVAVATYHFLSLHFDDMASDDYKPVFRYHEPVDG